MNIFLSVSFLGSLLRKIFLKRNMVLWFKYGILSSLMIASIDKSSLLWLHTGIIAAGGYLHQIHFAHKIRFLFQFQFLSLQFQIPMSMILSTRIFWFAFLYFSYFLFQRRRCLQLSLLPPNCSMIVPVCTQKTVEISCDQKLPALLTHVFPIWYHDHWTVFNAWRWVFVVSYRSIRPHGFGHNEHWTVWKRGKTPRLDWVQKDNVFREKKLISQDGNEKSCCDWSRSIWIAFDSVG